MNKKVGLFSPFQKNEDAEQRYSHKSSQKLNEENKNTNRKIVRYEYKEVEGRVQDSRPSHKRAYQREMVRNDNQSRSRNNIINGDCENTKGHFNTTYNEISRHQNSRQDEF